MSDNGKPAAATPEEIWTILREVSANQRETDRRIQQTDEMLQRQARETDRRLRKLDELFNGQWGKLIETLVEGDLVEGDLVALLNGRGITVRQTSTHVKRIADGVPRWEIDILALNGEEVVAVEVKTTLKVRHVDHFVERMRGAAERLAEYRGRRVYGAVAYLKADEGSDTYAENQGLFVIRAAGSSASITNRPDFTPRVFT